jgi:hypothetical protein
MPKLVSDKKTILPKIKLMLNYIHTSYNVINSKFLKQCLGVILWGF